VLIATSGKRKSSYAVKKCFNIWRQNKNPSIPIRCDNKNCYFYNKKLIWNGKPLDIILDHIDGVNSNDNPTNLRFLCPNCNSQNKKTLGGANKGRVEKRDGGFGVKDKNGNYYNWTVTKINKIIFPNRIICPKARVIKIRKK
jgi:5-methylcytosine-specific restriction endonuclease McrA